MSHVSFNSKKSIPLQIILIVPFVVQIAGAVGLVGYLSLKNGQKAVNELADRLLHKTATIVNQNLDSYLSVPPKIIHMNADAIQMGILDVTQKDKVGQYFWNQMQAYDLSYIGYGLTTGEGAGAARYDGKTTVIDEWTAQVPNNNRTYATDAFGNRTQLIELSDYDLLNQSWYLDPLKAGKPIWSQIYIWDNPITPFISLSAGRPIYDSNQTLLGMTGADIHLLKLSDFLAQSNPSQNGFIFIVERNGLLIAISDSTKPYKQVDGLTKRIAATEVSNPVIQNISKQIQASYPDGFNSIKETTRLEFISAQKKYFVYLTPWVEENGLDWVVAISIPEQEFMAKINANNRTTALLCLGAVMVAIVLGILTSRWIAYPLQKLNRASQAMAEGNLEQSVETSPILEVQALSRSFNTMAEQLKNSFLALQQTNVDLEHRVEERTLDLKNTLEELQRTQEQIVQSEKMSSLGQLVAGVAHEINNPVNFIHGNISHLDTYTQDLIKILQLYQSLYSNPHPEIEAVSEEIELDFIVEDLPKMLSSIKIGTERIRTIVLSLRNFARMDESPVKDVDLHEGIDNTLMLLAHRFKTNTELTPQIKVIKEYGSLPYVECYAGQVNQVFMNVLSNAIDAVEERYQFQVEKGLIPEPGIITIKTQLTPNEMVNISILDNGNGVNKYLLNQLFNPFFTTKPIGKGTGLGLSISYSIIQKHGGNISVESEVDKGTKIIILIPHKIKIDTIN
ncbi:sensor histidine kinase [Laspinema olomoucense]|uniref:sensor histidine kinase n=1 Tax=Laspinema olomoucense TaxID=3231600 RepID=UPI0021BB34A1|nr:ATP-binding protein [Laspinema sp. D3c]MCT7995283.1 ATP-binding protein [Laspinema sp. D3c]